MMAEASDRLGEPAATLQRVAAFCFTRLTFFGIARVLVRFDHVASFSTNANHNVEAVVPNQDQAIDYAVGRACFRSGEIRILDLGRQR